MNLEKILHENTEVYFLKGACPRPLIQCVIEGIPTSRGHEIINSIVDFKDKQLLFDWKRKVADEIKEKISKPTTPKQAAVSLSFFFCSSLRGNRKLDAENFIKPILDGIAKGLYAKDWGQDCNGSTVKFNEDDSVFRWAYFERHDIKDSRKESVHVTVWENQE